MNTAEEDPLLSACEESDNLAISTDIAENQINNPSYTPPFKLKCLW